MPILAKMYEASPSSVWTHNQFSAHPERWFSVIAPGPLGTIVKQLGGGMGLGIGVFVCVQVVVGGAGVGDVVGVGVSVGVNVTQLPDGAQTAPKTGLQPSPHMPLTGGPQAGRLH